MGYRHFCRCWVGWWCVTKVFDEMPERDFSSIERLEREIVLVLCVG